MLLYCGRTGLRNLSRSAQARLYRPRPFQSRFTTSASASKGWKRDSIELPIGVSGRVKLDIFLTQEPRQTRKGPQNLLVHLPPGPTIGTTTAPSRDIFSQLKNLIPPSTSMVSINYRLGPSSDTSKHATETTCFPIPIHEVSTALDHLTSSTSPFNADQDKPPKICLLGSHIGGALATTLALTEPNDIHALAVIEPMVDWVGLDEALEQLRAAESTSSTSFQRRSMQKITTRYGADTRSVLAAAEEMAKLRSKLFKTPSAYFDPFASPILFLRAPGRDTPLATTVGDHLVNEVGLDEVDGGYADYDADSFGPYDDEWQQSSPSTVMSSSNSQPLGSTSETSGNGADQGSSPTLPSRRRKVLRRWPAVGVPESVTLPHVRIFTQSPPQSQPETDLQATESDNKATDIVKGHAALMRAQGLEMGELMRRACFIGRERSFAEERVRVQQCERTISDSEGGDMQKKAVEWVGDMFVGNASLT